MASSPTSTWDAAPVDVFDPLDVLEAGSFKSLRGGKGAPSTAPSTAGEVALLKPLAAQVDPAVATPPFSSPTSAMEEALAADFRLKPVLEEAAAKAEAYLESTSLLKELTDCVSQVVREKAPNALARLTELLVAKVGTPFCVCCTHCLARRA